MGEERGGVGGCEPRIEIIVKLKKFGVGWCQVMDGVGGVGEGRGRADVNQELKYLRD